MWSYKSDLEESVSHSSAVLLINKDKRSSVKPPVFCQLIVSCSSDPFVPIRLTGTRTDETRDKSGLLTKIADERKLMNF